MLSLVSLSTRYPRTCVATLVLLLLAGAPYALQLRLRTDGAAIYPIDDAVVRQTLEDRHRFLDADDALIVVEPQSTLPAIGSPLGLNYLRSFHRTLIAELAPHDMSVRSAASLFRVIEDGPGWQLSPLLDAIPHDPGAFATFLASITSEPAVNGLYLSTDATAALVIVALPDTSDRSGALSPIVRFLNSDLSLYRATLTGPVLAEVTLGTRVLEDLLRLIPLSACAMAAILYICLRSLLATLLPLLVALCTLGFTAEIMGILSIPITLLTTILPATLMAIGLTDDVHIVESLQRAVAERDSAQPPQLSRVVNNVFVELSAPLRLMALTTAVGLLSFTGSSVAPLRDFGITMFLGTSVNLILTTSLLPALLTLCSPRFLVRRAAAERRFRYNPSPRAALIMFTTSLIAVSVAVPGIFTLRIQDSWIENFDPSAPLVSANNVLNTRFWGAYRFDVVLEGNAGFFHTAEGFQTLAQVESIARSAPNVGGLISPTDLLTPIARRLNDGARPADLSTPQLRTLLALAGTVADKIELFRTITRDGAVARIRLFVRNADYQRTETLRAWLQDAFEKLSAPVTYRFTGEAPAALRAVRTIVHDQLASLALATAGIAALVFAVTRRARIVALVMTPVLLSALLIFGLLGYSQVPLGVATAMFATLTLGESVDFGLHLAYAHDRHFRRCGNATQAMHAALQSIGRSSFHSALVLSGGFLVLVASRLKPVHELGVLLGLALASSYLMTVVSLAFLLPRVNFDETRAVSH